MRTRQVGGPEVGGPDWEQSFAKFAAIAAKRVHARLAMKTIPECGKALARNPRDYKALVNRAFLLMARKDCIMARRDLNAALMIEPNDAVALALRALVRLRLGDNRGFQIDSARAGTISSAESEVIFQMAGSAATPFMRARGQ